MEDGRQPSLENAQAAVDQASEAARQDPCRPVYHAICPANWMNDPNGPIAINDEIHVFYQHHPFKADPGPMYWGHMKSTDMVHWTHLPIAFGPSWALGENGCWSGCCIKGPDGNPCVLYTSVGPDRPALTDSEQWLVIGSEDMASWEKLPGNPVMTHVLHEEVRIEDWRDPCAWREGDIYYCVLGGHIVDEETTPRNNPSAFLYQSPDLVHWTFLGPMYSRFNSKIDADRDENVNLGINWECPLFFHLDGRHVLEVSVNGTAYAIGDFDGLHFIAGRWHALDNSSTFYAPNTFLDNNGRRIIIGWILARGNGTWNGCFSLPRVLHARPDETLELRPIPELEHLRDVFVHREAISLPPNASEPLIKGEEATAILETRAMECHFKIAATMQDDGTAVLPEFDLQVYKLAGKYDILGCFGYDSEESLIFVGHKSGPFKLEANEQGIDAHLFIDRKVIEIFINNRWTLTNVIDINPDTPITLIISSLDDPVEIDEIDCWSLKSIEM
ncbi:MAG TPA: glycoside hydrolase family 32 protein [Candidatus Lokiarchaeia archaeon]|nr:glycoside hydrolase family 32 protein [Candidatus Lokiarchaeia archaeon]